MLKPLSYSGHPVAITVKIHNQDVTSDLASLDDITRGIDYPNLQNFASEKPAGRSETSTAIFRPTTHQTFSRETVDDAQGVTHL